MESGVETKVEQSHIINLRKMVDLKSLKKSEIFLFRKTENRLLGVCVCVFFFFRKGEQNVQFLHYTFIIYIERLKSIFNKPKPSNQRKVTIDFKSLINHFGLEGPALILFFIFLQ